MSCSLRLRKIQLSVVSIAKLDGVTWQYVPFDLMRSDVVGTVSDGAG